jgi:hypothetical protein
MFDFLLLPRSSEGPAALLSWASSSLVRLALLRQNDSGGANGLVSEGRICVHGDWYEAKEMVEGMLAEPQWLRGHQESRLREFLELVQFNSAH